MIISKKLYKKIKVFCEMSKTNLTKSDLYTTLNMAFLFIKLISQQKICGFRKTAKNFDKLKTSQS